LELNAREMLLGGNPETVRSVTARYAPTVAEYLQ
jgi:hypothetical protein